MTSAKENTSSGIFVLVLRTSADHQVQVANVEGIISSGRGDISSGISVKALWMSVDCEVQVAIVAGTIPYPNPMYAAVLGPAATPVQSG